MKESLRVRFDGLVIFLQSWGMTENKHGDFYLHLNEVCFEKMMKEARNRLNPKEVEFLSRAFITTIGEKSGYDLDCRRVDLCSSFEKHMNKKEEGAMDVWAIVSYRTDTTKDGEHLLAIYDEYGGVESYHTLYHRMDEAKEKVKRLNDLQEKDEYSCLRFRVITLRVK